MIIKAKTYVVYEHIYNEEIIYIGSGTISRAFDFKQRNDDYKNIVKDLDLLKVNIVKMFDDRKEAYDFETKYSLDNKDNENYNLLNKAFGYKAFGENNGFFGKTHSKEAKERMSKARKGSKLNEDTKLKIKEGNIGKHKGGKNSQSKKIKVTNIKTKKVTIYDSMIEAAEGLNISYPCVKRYSLEEKPYHDYIMKRV